MNEFPRQTESVRDDPWKVLIAVRLLNVTTGKAAIPVFCKIISRWPTPQDLVHGGSCHRARLIYQIDAKAPSPARRARRTVETARALQQTSALAQRGVRTLPRGSTSPELLWDTFGFHPVRWAHRARCTSVALPRRRPVRARLAVHLLCGGQGRVEGRHAARQGTGAIPGTRLFQHCLC